jgi:hypothetical protein
VRVCLQGVARWPRGPTPTGGPKRGQWPVASAVPMVISMAAMRRAVWAAWFEGVVGEDLMPAARDRTRSLRWKRAALDRHAPLRGANKKWSVRDDPPPHLTSPPNHAPWGRRGTRCIVFIKCGSAAGRYGTRDDVVGVTALALMVISCGCWSKIVEQGCGSGEEGR